MNNIILIEFPSNLGLKESLPGHEPGVRFLPDYLKKYGFHSTIQVSQVKRLNPPPYRMILDPESKVRNADDLIDYAERQASILVDTVHKDYFSLVLGGDCSILIGNALALKQCGTFGLFFLDGHTDFSWPGLSQTGGAAGMDLAIAAGYGPGKLTNIDNRKPYFSEDHIWCVGNRYYQQEYVDAIEHSKINYFPLDTLRTQGISNCVERFLAMVYSEKLDGYWIHIDVDVLADDIMPAVDSRQPDGLTYEEFNKIIRLLLDDPKAIGLEITILDPELDPTGIYTQAFVINFCNTFNQATKNR